VIQVLGLVAVAVIVFAGSQVFRAARRAAPTPGYWRRWMSEPLQPGDFRLVALGDSSVEAIGADTPMHGYVGRIAEYVSATTGRHVHITNVSNGGTTADIVRVQKGHGFWFEAFKPEVDAVLDLQKANSRRG
jgi:hypothetical protein